MNNKYPLVFEPRVDTFLPFASFTPLTVSFYRQILLSDSLNNSDSITISINSKSLNLNKAMLKFFCIDKEENIVVRDSIDINNENTWGLKSISFDAMNTKRIVLGIYALGYDFPTDNKQKKLWIDKISIQANRRILYTNNQNSVLHENIDYNHLVEINFPFDKFSKANLPNDVKIVGIGEAVHGSKTVNQIEIELVKDLILHNSCKLVLIEGDMFQQMLWNLFVQGKIPEDYIDEIRKDISSTGLISPDIFVDFIVWLRKYNKDSDEKVYIQGLLDIDYGLENHLFHYLYTFYNNSTATTITPLLKKLRMQTLSDALDLTKESKASLETILGNTEYANFLYALEKAVEVININRTSSNISLITPNYYRILYRDFSMAENVNRFISSYLQNDQKACIIAHNAHVNKKLSMNNFPHLYSMGYLLHQIYGEKYYAVGIFPGEGSISFMNDDNTFFKEFHLRPTSANSLEYACSQKGMATFFYPTKYLKNHY